MKRIHSPLAVGILLSTALSTAAEPEIRVVTDKSGQTIAVAASGLSDLDSARAKSDEFAGKVFTVCVADAAGGDELPAMLGTYTVELDVLRFTPKYPFRSETAYREVVSLPDRKPIAKDFVIADLKPAERTRVAAVYPSATVLPENLLKFYLHFTGPMGRGEAYKHLRLLKSNGKEIDTPFLEIGEELWDASGTRLTLLIDPGRIKKGVKPREDIGPALEAGEEYRLLINDKWRDASGKPLTAGFEKRFKAGPPIETEINVKEWKIKVPESGSSANVRVEFGRPLDHALLGHTFRVHGPDGKPVTGKSTIGEEDRRWSFVPDVAWSPGVHRIVINTVLEDLAGNRIGKAFEVDELRPLDKVVDVESVELPFLVK